MREIERIISSAEAGSPVGQVHIDVPLHPGDFDEQGIITNPQKEEVLIEKIVTERKKWFRRIRRDVNKGERSGRLIASLGVVVITMGMHDSYLGDKGQDLGVFFERVDKYRRKMKRLQRKSKE